MKFTQSVTAVLVVAQCAAALAIEQKSSSLEKRQLAQLLGLPPETSVATLFNPVHRNNVQALMWSMGNGTMAHLMGEQNATQILRSFARVMGATRDTAGLFMKLNLEKSFEGYGLVSDPPEAKNIPSRQISKSKVITPGSKAIKIRYGPYRVPASNVTNFVGELGMLSNYPHIKVPKPCDGDCTIVGFRAGLEYPDGSNANIDTGMWLHHGVLFAVGPGRKDVTCSDGEISIPHVSVNTTAYKSERIYTFGNERTEIVFSDMGAPYLGYKIRAADEFAALVELMNENPEDRVVYMTITYDVIDGHPFKDDVTAIWHDIRNCGTSEVNPPKNQTKFELNATWKSTIDAELIGGLVHLHDGGTSSKLEVNGVTACIGTAQYGRKAEYISSAPPSMPGMEGMEVHGPMKHISDINLCGGEYLSTRRIQKGEAWTIRAAYDFDQNPGMKNKHGGWDEVMGIIVTYARKKGDQSIDGWSLTDYLPELPFRS